MIKICLIIRHMIIAFCVTGILLPVSVNAAESCARVLVRKPSQNEIADTLESLAKLKLSLDLARGHGTRTLLARMLEVEYKNKKNELLKIANLSVEELHELLSKRIKELQKKKSEEQIVRSEQEFLRTPFVKTSLPLKDSKSPVFVSADNKLMLTSPPDHAVAGIVVDIATGVPVLETHASTAIPMSKEQKVVLVSAENVVRTLDLKTLQLDKTVFAVVDLDRGARLQASPNQKTFVIYDSAGKYYELALSGQMIHKGQLPPPTQRPLTPLGYFITVVNDHLWILDSRNDFYRFDPTTQDFEHIMPYSGANRIIPFPGTDKILLKSGYEDLSVYDTQTKKTVTRTVEYLKDILPAESSENAWLVIDDKFSLIKVSDLSEISTIESDLSEFFISKSFDESYYSFWDIPEGGIYRLYGLYDRKSMSEPFFILDETRNTEILAHRLSWDGTSIYNVLKLENGSFQLDIWKRRGQQ